jgi:hypothetical protein
MAIKNLSVKISLIVTFLLVFVSCKTTADYQIRQIPQPLPTAKVRILVLMISGFVGSYWTIPHKAWARESGKAIEKQFSQTDIYDVIPYEDLHRVISEEPEWWLWEREDWDLAKRVGRALHADYLLIQYRDNYRGIAKSRMTWINLETEKKIEFEQTHHQTSYYPNILGDRAKADRDARVKIFNLSKEELLAIAIRRGRSITTPTSAKQVATLPSEPIVEKPVVKKVPEIEPLMIVPKVVTEKPVPPVEKPVVKKPPQIEPPVAAPKVAITKPVPPVEKPVVKEPPKVEPPVTAPKVVIAKLAPPVEEKVIKKPTQVDPPVTAPKVVIAKLSPPVEEKVVKKPPQVEPPLTAPKVAIAKPVPLVEKPVVKELPKVEPPVTAPKIAIVKPAPPVEKPVVKEISAIAQPVKKVEVPRGEAKRKIVVYDFETSEQLKVVALILSETARQEFLTTGQYSLINRENIMLIMEEHKLRGSGLITDNKASVLGNWMAADEAVTGKLSLLGNTLVLQLKMININTVETLALSSIHGSVGKEVELIRGMPALVKQLIEGRK